MSVIASSTVNNDEDLVMDKNTWNKLKQIDIDDAEQYMDSESSSDSDEEKNVNMPSISKHLLK
jgi:hypothetical protein